MEGKGKMVKEGKGKGKTVREGKGIREKGERGEDYVNKIIHNKITAN